MQTNNASAWWREDLMKIILLSFPLILTNFAHVAISTVDVVVLGALGTKEIAAGGLAIALFNQLRTTGTGLVTSVGNLVAEARARNETDRIRALLVAGFFWATVSGLVFAVALLLLGRPLVWLGQDTDVVALAIRFLLIVAPGLIPCLWFQTLRHFTVGLKYPGPLLAITAISILLTASLNYTLVFGKFGFPALGIQGVALTSSIVFLLSFMMLFGVVLKNGTLSSYFTLSGLRFSVREIGDVWRLGLPIAATYASEAGFFSVLTLLVGTLGVKALAAQTVLNQIIYIVFMISAGISHAASIHISEACGLANYIRARWLGFMGLALGIAAMSAIAVPYILAPDFIVSLFISADQQSNDTTLTLAASGLLIAIVLQVFDASQNIGNGILRGAGDTAGPFRISLIGYWLVGLPCAYGLGVVAGYGIYGIWVGQTIGLAATAALLVGAFTNRIADLSRQGERSSFEAGNI